MKKIILSSLVVILLFVIFFVYKLNQPITNYSTYFIEDNKYHLLEAKNPIEWTRGLMYYKNKSELKGADGMIFIFPVKIIQRFWNKNTYLDLDIIWMDGDKVVGKSYLPSILKTKEPLTVQSPVEADRVVEIAR